MAAHDAKGTVVNRKEIYLASHTGSGERFVRKIRYSADKQKFYAELPGEEAIALDRKHSEGETMADAIAAWEKDCVEAKKIKTVKRKVIVVEWKAEARIGKRQVPNERVSGYSRWDSNHVEEHETKLKLSVQIANEHAIGDRKEYFLEKLEDDKPKELRVNEDDVVLEWTPERELFFSEALRRLKESIFAVHAFMTTGEKKMLEKISENADALFLPAPKT